MQSPPSQIFCAYIPFVQIVPQLVSSIVYVHWPPSSQPVGCEHRVDPTLHLDAQQFPPSSATPQMSEVHWLSAPQGEPGDFKLPPVVLPPVVFPPLVPPPAPLVVLPAPVPLLELFDDSSQATIAIMIPNRAQVFTASSARGIRTPRARSAEKQRRRLSTPALDDLEGVHPGTGCLRSQGSRILASASIQ